MPSDWKDLGVDSGGVVGGDGAGEAHTRRFTRDNGDGTFVALDIAYYSVDIAERWGEDNPGAGKFDVEGMTSETTCTDLDDPGGTELNSEIAYDLYPSDVAFDTEAKADAFALNAAEMFDPAYLVE